MYTGSSIDEKFVSRIWDSGRFTLDALRAKDGRKIEVIYRGRRNDDSGADFHNAEIRVDGLLQKGDVEIHVKNSHWRAHRHNTNPRYNNTILHVAMWDDCISLLIRKQNGERIPTLVLYDYLDRPIGKLWKTIENGEEEPDLCREKAETMTQEAIGAVLDRAGMDRFLQRTQALEECLGEKNEDQLLYEGMMEALGYSKNKEPFLELARKVPLKLLVGGPPEKIQAILYGVAGLMPSQNGEPPKFDEDTQEYIDKIETLWEAFSQQFKGKQMLGEQWEFSGIRPENFPVRRIAGISYILSNCGDRDEKTSSSLLAAFLSAFSEHDRKAGEASRKLQDMLIPHMSGYWAKHYTFGGRRHKETPFLMGQNRAADMVINVILPIVLAHARQLEHEKLQQEVMAEYASHRKLQDNKVTRSVASGIFRDKKEQQSVINSAMRQQGLIHFYKNFCFVRNCRNCPLS